ncbi:MAG: NADH-quinone oxidoreductase subunit C [Myxococcota bacterium]
MTGSEIRQRVREQFPDAVLEEHDFRGDDTLVMKREMLHEVLAFLRDDPQLKFDLLMALCGADYLPLQRQPRFELVYHLFSVPFKKRLRVRFPIEEENLIVPSVVDLWVTADWHEREAFDMFGFKFKGHPNLRRILTHEDFEGHPLRKDYPVNRRTTVMPSVVDLLTPKPFNG